MHGGRELFRLAERGVLGERTTIAHGVYLRDADIDLMAERRAMVAHNCSSNLRLACGIAPVRRLVARGVTVGLGSDDMAVDDDEDMLAEVRMAHVAQRIWEGPEPPLGARDVLRLLWEGGARIAGLEGEVGRLEPGYHGDAVVLDLAAVRGVFASPRLSYEDLVVARAGRGHVREVVVGGRVLVRDGAPGPRRHGGAGRGAGGGRPRRRRRHATRPGRRSWSACGRWRSGTRRRSRWRRPSWFGCPRQSRRSGPIGGSTRSMLPTACRRT